MRSLLFKLGLPKSIVALTIATVVLSLTTTSLLLSFLGEPIQKLDVYLIAFLCPSAITPFVAYFVFKLVFELNSQEQEMRHYAQWDSLTNFLTRRAWFQFAEQYEVIAKRQRQPYTLLMLDLDNFKKLNDDHGHLAGDAILKKFADLTRELARDSDIIGRFGGEEFIFLLPDTSADQAYSLCERLHNKIRNTSLRYNDINLTFTTSIGLACQSIEHDHSLDHLISLADDALYTAKARGKNCSFLHREPPSSNTPSYA